MPRDADPDPTAGTNPVRVDAERPDEGFLRRALKLARSGWGTTHPNPMVGAVIVEGGEVVAEGCHLQAGGPHAELRALAELGRPPKPGATLYVTLEPCSTAGRTPPCTEAILRAGLRRVFVGTPDPNPAHAGRGVELLRAAGVEVEVAAGPVAGDCADLNLIFNHWITRGTPLLAGKIALTLDGRTAARGGHSRWVTGAAARADVMRWRRYFPAIAVGSGTVLADDPALTARDPNDETWCPLRLVFDRRLRTAEAGAELPQLYRDRFAAEEGRTLVVAAPGAPEAARSRLAAAGVEVWEIGDGGVAPPAADFFTTFRRRCHEAGITGVYCEGGSTLLSALLAAGHLDYLFAYQAPKILGDTRALTSFGGREARSMDDAVQLADVRHAVLGDDVLTRGAVRYPTLPR